MILQDKQIGSSSTIPKYENHRAFELVFDKKSILVELEENDVDNEFDILAIIVNCLPPRYLMSMNKWLQELIVMDILITENKATLTSFTLTTRCYMFQYPIIMQIHYMNCGQHKMLIPRCRFNVNLEDNSGTTTGMIMNKKAEKLLSLTAEQIYERTSTKIFSIRAKKAFAKLYIQSCMEKNLNKNNIHEASKESSE
ncbi:hypothetical protein R3W88_028304 [Solanum pinnatisectum]|uniref:Uncharacterized protein n=1 Tax=Solanum pinnatisectum TaxID=50273 RepID=A0AAV9LM84_9SOLN|nr:hypothetical protein R3W88_028304 [Solanum pinnatisectum]